MIRVNEIFSTIQGEGAFTGMPATFVRLQGCDVGCPWCDTKHTWAVMDDARRSLSMIQAKSADSPLFADVSVDDLMIVIARYPASHVVLTGGEPCVHDLEELTTRILATDRSVQIETSGTQPIRANAGTWVTVSPKIDMPGGFQVLTSAIERADEIKLPVGKLSDIDKLVPLLVFMRPEVMIWLQPLSGSKKATDICIDSAAINGWRVSIQVHRLLGIR